MQRYQHPIERIIIFSPAAGFTLWQQDFQGNRIHQKAVSIMRNYVLAEKQTLYSLSQSGKKILRKLMIDFCIPEPTIDQIISQTEQEAKPTETARQVYNRAWQKFRKHLLTN